MTRLKGVRGSIERKKKAKAHKKCVKAENKMTKNPVKKESKKKSKKG